ncbi:MAG: NADH-quinone oxidoreductase [Candidatus Thermoplasmatota archaeon]|nr:NADH-quinone oxidoreductase [Candidatus Thermoplasmatota archaeon]
MSGMKNIDIINQRLSRGPLDKTGKAELARELGISSAGLESILTFYTPDRGEDLLCTGLPCRMKWQGRAIEMSVGAREESCLGYCDHAPVMRVEGKFVTVTGSGIAEIEESNHDFVKRNIEHISEYTLKGGYSYLEGEGGKIDGDGMLQRVEKSGLRGMGGAGFPVHLKWKSFRQFSNEDSYLLVNAHEGEPGTFKDRKILELAPHSVLDGAIIAAVSNGIRRIVVGIKKEYALGYASLTMAREELTERVRNSGHSIPEIEIIRAGGSYVTGEETALMEALEGRRSEPRLRPPFPTEIGLYSRPTLVHNAETLSAIASLASSGKELLKSYCLSGDVKHPGTYRVKIGTALGKLMESSGNGPMTGVKAVMPGGLSGGILPGSNEELKLDFDSVRKAGAGLGTGSVIVLSSRRCMVETAENVASFFMKESCGKCMP